MEAGTHLLYVLLDSNLPTGGFVASSGLESWAKHGFLSFDPDPASLAAPIADCDAGAAHGTRERDPRWEEHGNRHGRRPANPSGAAAGVSDFAAAEIENYHSTTGGFVRGAWEAVEAYLVSSHVEVGRRAEGEEERMRLVLDDLLRLDRYHECSMLSHVSRRASKAQGVAMLTLYTKGLSRPPGHSSSGLSSGKGEEGGDRVADGAAHRDREGPAREVVDAYKLLIRKGDAPGHLAVCWGIMTAALSIPLEQAIHLHLFLHARSLLSAAVRLNLIGPYLSSQLLLHPFRELIDRAAAASRDTFRIPAMKFSDTMDNASAYGAGDARDSKVHAADGYGDATEAAPKHGEAGKDGEGNDGDGDDDDEDPWAWTAEAESGPATTWPLGELLMARHDLQHSRIFNS